MGLHPDFERVVNRLLADFLASPGSSPDEVELARKYGALPIGTDFLSQCLLRPGGEVVYVDVLDEENVYFSNEPVRLTTALIFGGRRYLELMTLLPVRTARSSDCSGCGGSGYIVSRVFCPLCGGLGWLELGDDQRLV